MRLVDTSAWIERLVDSSTGTKVGLQLPTREKWLVPTMVQLELAKWLTREAGEDKADEVIAFSLRCTVAPLDTKIALMAAELCSQYKLATADAAIYATAQRFGADLLTCDAHFSSLPGVIYIAKKM
jgi:predicted nucleic acid-binding protein